MQNYLDRESALDIIYSDLSTHGYSETVDASYGSLWEDDVWQLNEQPVIQNDSESRQQEEFQSSGADFHNDWPANHWYGNCTVLFKRK